MKISDRICALTAVSVIFFAFSLFAEADQTTEKPAEEVKTEQSAETKAEESADQKVEAAVEEKTEQLDAATETKPDEAVEVKSEEAKPEETVEVQKESRTDVVIESVEDSENIMFSARSLDKMTWNEAQNYCKDLDFWGKTWRLPNIDEIRDLMRNCPATEPGGSCRVSEKGNCLAGNCSAPKESCTCERKAKNRGQYSMFGDADYIGLWSSSTLSNDAGKAWGAVFYSGMIGSVSKNTKLYARCVSGIDEKKSSAEEKDEKTGNVALATLEQGLSKDVIKEHFDKKMKDIVQCVYKGALEDKDLSHGGIAIDYTVSPTGEVTYNGVQMSTFGNLTIENCITKVVKEIKFPAPKNGTTVFANRSLRFLINRKK